MKREVVAEVDEVGHVGRGEPDQHREALGQHVVAERDPDDEQRAGDGGEQPGPLALVGVQPGHDERPDLVEPVRGGQHRSRRAPHSLSWSISGPPTPLMVGWSCGVPASSCAAACRYGSRRQVEELVVEEQRDDDRDDQHQRRRAAAGRAAPAGGRPAPSGRPSPTGFCGLPRNSPKTPVTDTSAQRACAGASSRSAPVSPRGCSSGAAVGALGGLGSLLRVDARLAAPGSSSSSSSSSSRPLVSALKMRRARPLPRASSGSFLAPKSSTRRPG